MNRSNKGCVLPIRVYGDKCLKQLSKKVAKVDWEIEQVIADMIETMYAKDGVGLAAPQIGKNLRIFVVDPQWFETGERKPIVFINPEFKNMTGTETNTEGCLSLPGIEADVTRAEEVTIETINEKGELVRHQAEGLFSRAIQHEYDHLDGTLFIDRIPKLKLLTLKGKLKRMEGHTDDEGVNTDENLNDENE